jgi:hypothetical protein
MGAPFKLWSLTDRNGCPVNGTDSVNVERGLTTSSEDSNSEGDGGRRGSLGFRLLSELLLVPWIGVLASLVIVSAGVSFLTPYFLTLNNILGTVAPRSRRLDACDPCRQTRCYSN